MSYTAVILPILSVLSVAEQTFLGTQAKWQPYNQEQTILLRDYYTQKDDLNKLLPDELKSMASRDISKVNRFLKKNGFEIQLNETASRGDSFAVASILKVMLEWRQEGTKTRIFANNTEYPAVRMNKGFTIRKISGQNDHIVSIKAKNGDTVHMSMADKPLAGFELLAKIQMLKSELEPHFLRYAVMTYDGTKRGEWHTSYKNVTNEFDSLEFPMVDIKQEVDIKWLENMTHGLDRITQALQETHFQMNEKGAAVHSAAAIKVDRGLSACKPVFTIDKPFYLWIERPGMTVPLFTAYVDPSNWKEPAKLG